MANKKFMEEIGEELKKTKKELAKPIEEVEVKEEVEEKPKRLSRIEIARNIQLLKE